MKRSGTRSERAEGRGRSSTAPDLFAHSWSREEPGRVIRGWRSDVPDRDGFLERGAVYDPSEKYRYLLWRRWGAGPEVVWILLNPSTATEAEGGLDPTLRRCVGFSRSWGFGSMKITNLFALRSTNPHALYQEDDPVGSENDAVIREATARADEVVVGWGAHGGHRGRSAAVLALLAPRELVCLARTQGGQPGHPLYLSARAERALFRPTGGPV